MTPGVRDSSRTGRTRTPPPSRPAPPPPPTPPAKAPTRTAPPAATDRNPGTPLTLDWVRDARVNRSAVERRAATLAGRRTVKKQWQAAWLLRAITLMDLTTLQSDDTPGRVRRLCAKARQPVRRDLLESLGAESLPIRVAAVCVYHVFVEIAKEALAGSGIPVAAVSTGFPAGLSPLPQRLAEVKASVEAGADEIDIVITRAHALTGSVALTASLPVEVLMKSAPAIIATIEARPTSRRLPSSPVARIAFM